MKERDLMRLCTDWLAAEGYFVLRLNSGFFKFDSPNGKSRVFRGHKPGTADLLVMDTFTACTCAVQLIKHPLSIGEIAPACACLGGPVMTRAIFCELKTGKGKQSEAQKSFEQDILRRGMTYVLVRSLEDLQNALKGVK